MKEAPEKDKQSNSLVGVRKRRGKGNPEEIRNPVKENGCSRRSRDNCENSFYFCFHAYIFNIWHCDSILLFRISFLMLHGSFSFPALLLWRMVCV